MKLYILGNGFDIAHNLNTKYIDWKNFIIDNTKKNNDWEIILKYYPEKYQFWSDAEKYVCSINRSFFEDLKRVLDITLLDKLLVLIHDSFEKFIIEVEANIKNKKRFFTMDNNSFIITFNYTSVLEDLYGIKKDNILHIHNDVGNAIMKHIFNLNDKYCILGHSIKKDEFDFYKDEKLANDKDYINFIEKTIKDTKKIIKETMLEEKLKKLVGKIDEVVFYGFSFSPADKDYIKLIMKTIPPETAKYKVYYFVGNKETDISAKQKLINNISSFANVNNFTFINSNGIIKI